MRIVFSRTTKWCFGGFLKTTRSKIDQQRGLVNLRTKGLDVRTENNSDGVDVRTENDNDVGYAPTRSSEGQCRLRLPHAGNNPTYTPLANNAPIGSPLIGGSCSPQAEGS